MNHASPALGIPLMGPDPSIAIASHSGDGLNNNSRFKRSGNLEPGFQWTLAHDQFGLRVCGAVPKDGMHPSQNPVRHRFAASKMTQGFTAFDCPDHKSTAKECVSLMPEILHVPAQFCIILRFEFWQGPLGQESHEKLVPTERIELSTSPLPRGCSTAELCGRQRLGNSAGPCQKEHSSARPAYGQRRRKKRNGEAFGDGAV